MFITAVLGAILGAGFASGKEIQTFFTNYGSLSYVLMLIACAIFAWAFYLFARLGRIVKPHSISDITRASLGKASFVVDIFLILSMFVTLSAMLSATDGFAQTVDSNYTFPWASLGMVLLVILTLCSGNKSIFKTNSIVMPTVVSMIFIVLISFFAGTPKHGITIEWVQPLDLEAKGVLFAFLYAGLNTVNESFIVAKVSEKMNRKQSFIASIGCALIILLFIFLISTALINAGDDVYNSSLPMLKLAYLTNTGIGNSYGLILLLAIFSCLISTTYTITCWLKQFIKNRYICITIVVLVGFALSRLGFENIVQKIYPLKGIFGLVILSAFSLFYITHTKSKKLDYQYTSRLYY